MSSVKVNITTTFRIYDPQPRAETETGRGDAMPSRNVRTPQTPDSAVTAKPHTTTDSYERIRRKQERLAAERESADEARRADQEADSPSRRRIEDAAAERQRLAVQRRAQLRSEEDEAEQLEQTAKQNQAHSESDPSEARNENEEHERLVKNTGLFHVFNPPDNKSETDQGETGGGSSPGANLANGANDEQGAVVGETTIPLSGKNLESTQPVIKLVEESPPRLSAEDLPPTLEDPLDFDVTAIGFELVQVYRRHYPDDPKYDEALIKLLSDAAAVEADEPAEELELPKVDPATTGVHKLVFADQPTALSSAMKAVKNLQREGVFGQTFDGRPVSVREFLRQKEFEYDFEEKPFTIDAFLRETENAIYEALKSPHIQAAARDLIVAAESVNAFRNHLVSALTNSTSTQATDAGNELEPTQTE